MKQILREMVKAIQRELLLVDHSSFTRSLAEREINKLEKRIDKL
jgi:hypothetical protein